MKWIQRSIWEIKHSDGLRWLGGLLALSHVITFFFWRDRPNLFENEMSQALLCWDFFPHCQESLSLSGSFLQMGLNTYLVFAGLAAGLFFFRRLIGLAWWLLLFSFIFYAGLYTYEASFKENIHALLIAVQFCFFFVPKKNFATTALILAFYMVDSYLKLRPEWLSGASMVGALDIPIKAMEWAAAFTVLIQMVMPFLIISKDGQRLTYGLLSLSTTHLFWFWVTGDLTHIVLSYLPSYLIFEFFERQKLQRNTMYKSYEHPEPSNVYWPIALGVFLLAQTIFIQSHYPAPLLRISPPKFSESCKLLLFEQKLNTISQVQDQPTSNIHPNLKCHPQLNLNLVESLCETYMNKEHFHSLSAIFLTKGLSDPSYKVGFAKQSLCKDGGA